MLQNIAPEITIASFSIIGILTGYIWNDQNRKIKETLEKIEVLPCHTICTKIEKIENNIEWIKKYLIKN